MRLICRAYDIQDLGGSAVSLRTTARFLADSGDEVWSTRGAHTLDEVREWTPDLIIGQQWATQEASEWATALRVPFAMMVRGPGQYEHFRPQCDLVVFNSEHQRKLAQGALGRTPSTVLHPPVLRNEYATDDKGDCLTLFGASPEKGLAVLLELAGALPGETFLLVTDDGPNDLPANVRVQPRIADPRPIYARTKLLLMPSQYESYGRVAVEAAMSSIPTVASDLPGIREATADGAALVGPGDKWVEAVRMVLEDLDTHRQRARSLANARDPTDELRGFRQRLLEVVAAGRRRPTMTLCMTVANEGDTIEKAVESVSSQVDEIVIGVDAKSTDETADIASRMATRTFEFDESSPPDFPRMRNRVMELVETDWAIVLDGHEWIENADSIGSALETTAWCLEIQTLYEPDENRVPGIAFAFPRIHRRHVRFVGAPAHEEVSAPPDKREYHPEIKVWHERKPGKAAEARSTDKTGKELDALRVAWVKQGNRRALFYLANGLREAGRYEEAIAEYQTYLEAPNFEEEGWQALLYLARCHVARHDLQQARPLFERAVLQFPDRAEAAAGLGHVLLEMGDADAAAAWFRMAASLQLPTRFRLFVEVPVYRWGAWHGLALALDRLGDYAGAVEAEERALAGGAGPWARENIERWRGMSRPEAV